MPTPTPQTTANESRYTFDNADTQGPYMLRLLADILDEHSMHVLRGTGIGAGWRCLDLGPGAGTITTWLADQVRDGGHVTALDLDPCHIEPGSNLSVVAGDVRTADVPTDYYDLIHARLLLLHVPEREQVVARLVRALKPGGVLVVSDWDATRRDWLLHATTDAAGEAFEAFQAGLLAVLEANGADLRWARRAPLVMRRAGLFDIDTTVYSRLWAGGEAGCLLHESNSRQLEQALRARGVTVGQLNRLRQAMQDPETLAYGYWMFTTVGRRPED
jgi:SAM-dependent methyltransferase